MALAAIDEAGMSSGFESPDELELEAGVLHQLLFGAPPPAAVADRYRAAVKALLGPATAADPSILGFRERPARLEMAELALRRRDRTNALTTRAHVMLYVTECRRDHFHQFINDRPRRTRAAMTLAVAVLRTAWFLWRGRSAAGIRPGR
jgi:hypothetical protein